jgi:hypothetical protein
MVTENVRIPTELYLLLGETDWCVSRSVFDTVLVTDGCGPVCPDEQY